MIRDKNSYPMPSPPQKKTLSRKITVFVNQSRQSQKEGKGIPVTVRAGP
jgi:hypothetical protein